MLAKIRPTRDHPSSDWISGRGNEPRVCMAATAAYADDIDGLYLNILGQGYRGG